MTTGVYAASVQVDRVLESDPRYIEAAMMDLRRRAENAIGDAVKDGRTYVVSQRHVEGPLSDDDVKDTRFVTCILLRHPDDCSVGEHCETINYGTDPHGHICYADGREWQYKKLYGFEYWERIA